MVLFLCAGLLLSMNTATMDGSRALYALSREGMTVKQLGVLNSHHVPARAMTLDMLLNIFLLFAFPSIFFVLAAGNLGYMLSHVLALSGFLLLRRDRPELATSAQARPGLGGAGAAVFARLQPAVHHLRRDLPEVHRATRGTYDFTDPTAFVPRIILVGVLALVAGVARLRHRPVPARQAVPAGRTRPTSSRRRRSWS